MGLGVVEEVGCAQPLPVEQLDRSGSRLLLPRALLHVTTELKAIPILGQGNGSETSLRARRSPHRVATGVGGCGVAADRGLSRDAAGGGAGARGRFVGLLGLGAR